MADLRDWTGIDLSGKNDSAADFQAAVNETAAGGDVLRIPAGRIALGAGIDLPPSSRIEGPGRGALWQNEGVTAKNAVFHIAHAGIGFEAIAGAGARTVRGISTVRTQPLPAPGWEPDDLGFDFDFVGVSDAVMEDVHLFNPTRGIGMRGNPATGFPAGRIDLRGISGQPLMTGIEAHHCTDVCYWDEIRFWPFWSNDTAVRSYMRANATAFSLYRMDNPQIGRVFSIGYRRAMRLGRDAGGGFPALPAGNMAKGQVAMFGADSCGCGIDIAGDCAYANLDIANFYAQGGTAWYGTGDDDLIRDAGANTFLTIGRAELAYTTQGLVGCYGTGGFIGMRDLRAYNWDGNSAGIHGIVAGQGSSGHRLQIGSLWRDSETRAFHAHSSAIVVEAPLSIPYAPVCSPLAGTISQMGAVAGSYTRAGNQVTVNIVATVTMNGTGAGALNVTMPFLQKTGAISAVAHGRQTNGAGKSIMGVLTGQTIAFTTHDGLYPMGDGQSIRASITYAA